MKLGNKKIISEIVLSIFFSNFAFSSSLEPVMCPTGDEVQNSQNDVKGYYVIPQIGTMSIQQTPRNQVLPTSEWEATYISDGAITCEYRSNTGSWKLHTTSFNTWKYYYIGGTGSRLYWMETSLYDLCNKSRELCTFTRPIT